MTARLSLQRQTLRRSLAILGLGSLLGWVVSASVHPAPTLAFVAPRHATARNFTPAPNTVVSAAPTAALLLGDEGVGNGPDDYIDVFDSAGVERSGPTNGREAGNLSLVSTPLSAVEPGWYTAHWNVESADGHMAGGSDGAWWVFGVRVKTASAPVRRMSLGVDVAASGLPSRLGGEMNGVRVGQRKLTFAKTSATFATVRVKLMKTRVSQLSGLEFDWPVGYDKKAKKFYATGALPFVGTYRFTVQAFVGSITGVWRTEVVVGS